MKKKTKNIAIPPQDRKHPFIKVALLLVKYLNAAPNHRPRKFRVRLKSLQAIMEQYFEGISESNL